MFLLGLAYLYVALTLLEATHGGWWPDADWGLPWGLTARQLMLAASVLAVLSIFSATLLWRLMAVSFHAPQLEGQTGTQGVLGRDHPGAGQVSRAG